MLPGSTVRLQLASIFEGATDIVWMCDEQVVKRTGATPFLELENFREFYQKTGYYYANFSLDGVLRSSTWLKLKPTPFNAAPLLNLSARATLSPDTPQLITGFVVGLEGTVGGQTRPLLIRAIGPSLAEYGVSTPLPDPRLRLLDSSGNEIDPMPRWDASTWWSYEGYLQAISASVGAFPIPIPALWEADYPGEPVFIYDLPAGAYTVVVDSVSNTGGEVIAEIYEAQHITPPQPIPVVPVGGGG